MQNIKEYVAYKKLILKELIEMKRYKIKTAIIQVGDNPASNAYIKGKLADCKFVGIECTLYKFPAEITEKELLKEIKALNKDKSLTGYIVQLPLPKHINETTITEAIDYRKDIDGFTKKSLVNPATPQGILTYLEDNNYDFTNKNAVVIGRSNIVGRPIARLLLDKSCNVTIIHSKTSELNKAKALYMADLIIVATGHRNTLVDAELAATSEDCFIVDVGMNKNELDRLCGDCESVSLRNKTPVPGGVGLLTRLALLLNIIALYEKIYL